MLDASIAAIRAKLGGGGPPNTDEVLLGLRVRAEFGVGTVLFAMLAQRMVSEAEPLPADHVDAGRWRAELSRSMTAWGLERHEHWHEATGRALLPQALSTRAPTPRACGVATRPGVAHGGVREIVVPTGACRAAMSALLRQSGLHGRGVAVLDQWLARFGVSVPDHSERFACCRLRRDAADVGPASTPIWPPAQPAAGPDAR